VNSDANCRLPEARIPKECDSCVVSPEFPVFAPDLKRILPETLDVYFRTPAICPRLSGASTGTNVRRKRLNPDDFLAYRIPLLSMSVQRQLRAVRRYADEMRRVQMAAVVELGALLPSVLDRAFKGQL
jgi:type I restriction enzyme, S subunit